MSSASTIKPEAGVVTGAYTRPAPAEVQQAVATELPAAKSVTAPAAAAASKNPPQNARDLSRQIILDAESREVIFRVMDARSRQVIWQVPEEALLRMRAYTRALFDGRSPIQARSHTDVRA
jgi:flagellar protein FlaG